MIDISWPPFEPRHLSVVSKWLIAVLGAAVLAWRAISVKRTISPKYARFPDIALGVLAGLAFLSWWHVAGLQFGTSFHRWEFFHYYLGAKYSAELEYTRLYDCVAAVEAEEKSSADVLYRWTRNLRTNAIEQGSPAARNPELCRAVFTPARWQEFKHDALFFRREAAASWTKMQMDHGYNATPVWNAVGHLLANTGPASTRQMVALALIDPVLIVTMWGLVWWAFGWRVMAVALLWWGTNSPARYFYLGGAFLRSDWLVMSVAGIALAKLGYMTVAGAALGWSALLRIFPGFLTSGAGLKLLRPSAWREPYVRDALRLLTGACIAIPVLMSLSAISPEGGVSAGVARWKGFVENSRKHLSGSSVNRVGLKTLMSFAPGTGYDTLGEFWIEGPTDGWQAVRQRTFEQRRVLYWTVVLAFLVLLAAAVRRQPYWVALVLGVGLIPMVADITCYYYGILLVYAFLSDRHPWIGVGLVSLSAFTLMVGPFSPSEEIRYTVISLGIIAYVFAVTGWIVWASRAASWQPAAARQVAA